MTMAKRGRPKGSKNKPEVPSAEIANAKAGQSMQDALEKATEDLSLANMTFWRRLAILLLGDKEPQKWRISEFATIVEEFSRLLAVEWRGISRSCDDDPARKINVGAGFELNRSDLVPLVKMKISYSRKWGNDSKVDVPDPDQTELPLTSDVPEEQAIDDTPRQGELTSDDPPQGDDDAGHVVAMTPEEIERRQADLSEPEE